MVVRRQPPSVRARRQHRLEQGDASATSKATVQPNASALVGDIGPAQLQRLGVVKDAFDTSAVARAAFTGALDRGRSGQRRERASQALSGALSPGAGHPYRQHVDGVRAALQAHGLPTSAEGVPVYVFDSGTHGDEVTRTIAGPTGLARGADMNLAPDLGLARPPEGYEPTALQTSLVEHRRGTDEQLVKGELDLNGLVDRLSTRAVLSVFIRKMNVHAATGAFASDKALGATSSKVAIANMSTGLSIAKLASDAWNTYQQLPEGSPLHQAIDNFVKAWPGDEGHHAFERLIADGVAKQLATTHKGLMEGAKGELEEALQQARETGLLVVPSAGNQHLKAARLGGSERTDNLDADVACNLVVGAHDTRGETADFSARARHMSVGVDVPVADPEERHATSLRGAHAQLAKASSGGTLTPTDVSGTSYAAPNVSATLALMSKANPELGAHELASLLDAQEGPIDVVALVASAQNA